MEHDGIDCHGIGLAKQRVPAQADMTPGLPFLEHERPVADELRRVAETPRRSLCIAVMRERDRHRQQRRKIGRRPLELDDQGARSLCPDSERTRRQFAAPDRPRIADRVQQEAVGRGGRRRNRTPHSRHEMRRFDRRAVRPARVVPEFEAVHQPVFADGPGLGRCIDDSA